MTGSMVQLPSAWNSPAGGLLKLPMVCLFLQNPAKIPLSALKSSRFKLANVVPMTINLDHEISRGVSAVCGKGSRTQHFCKLMRSFSLAHRNWTKTSWMKFIICAFWRILTHDVCQSMLCVMMFQYFWSVVHEALLCTLLLDAEADSATIHVGPLGAPRIRKVSRGPDLSGPNIRWPTVFQFCN